MEPLRAELAGMKLGELRKRARAAGVEAAAIEAAADESDQPKVAPPLATPGPEPSRR